jgi:hypothetical protein
MTTSWIPCKNSSSSSIQTVEREEKDEEVALGFLDLGLRNSMMKMNE